ncbi:hypothetical protein PRUPE_4G151800 [Prunus persica]|uniref:Uncharacterized protein n=1 Tax=Prunus persica TaxID=3760 RepID=A0A251PL00_PRUPE|nr:hypothetical protein PRUPE_4G151800 [Prunus persica]
MIGRLDQEPLLTLPSKPWFNTFESPSNDQTSLPDLDLYLQLLSKLFAPHDGNYIKHISVCVATTFKRS